MTSRIRLLIALYLILWTTGVAVWSISLMVKDNPGVGAALPFLGVLGALIAALAALRWSRWLVRKRNRLGWPLTRESEQRRATHVVELDDSLQHGVRQLAQRDEKALIAALRRERSDEALNVALVADSNAARAVISKVSRDRDHGGVPSSRSRSRDARKAAVAPCESPRSSRKSPK